MNFQSAKSALRNEERLRDAALTVLFAALLIFNIWRTLRHPMWRDEMQVFLLGADSPSLADLIRNLAYEPHPYLWHVLTWIGAHIYPDPLSMRIIHALLATWVWLLIWHAAPFRPIDKILLLLSYFLFWEYFVISRMYVLVALIGFSIVIVRTVRPQRLLLPFVLLGALANTMVLGTIWSMATAGILALQRSTPRSTRIVGSLIYLACLAIAVTSLIPSPESAPHSALPLLDASRLSVLPLVPVGALLPVDPQWLVQAARFVLLPGSEPPHYWNPNPHPYLLQLSSWPGAQILLQIGLVLLPLLLCAFLVRNRKIAIEFTLVYLGILSFIALWAYPGLSRHVGIVFLAFVSAVWMASSHAPLTGWRLAAWRSLLAISAIGGLLTLTSEVRPFSHGRSVAEWLTRHKLADAFIMGSRDTTLSTISGYLGRPLYYLECECLGRFIVWNRSRTFWLDPVEIARRVNRTQPAAGAKQTILISHQAISAEVAREHAPDRTLTLLQSFTGAEEAWENYYVFLVEAKPAQ